MDINAVINHLLRLVRLDTTVFDEVRDDEKELVPAAVVAVVASFLAGLGAFLWWKTVPSSTEGLDGVFLNTFLLGSIFMVALYGVAALVVYFIIVQVFKIQVDLQALIRVMGYAAWPLALSVIMFIPGIYPVFALLPLCLLFVMMIYAVQSVSGADSTQVVLACTAGLGVMFLVLGIIATSSEFPSVPMGAGQFGITFDIG